MKRALALLCLVPAVACDDGGEGESNPLIVPTTYAFESRFVPGQSSVSYGGQTLRHVLIEDLKSFMGTLTAQIDGAQFMPTAPGQVRAALDYYLRFDSEVSGGDAHRVLTTPAPLQSTYDDVSTKKNLLEKLAGNDASTDHVDFTGGGFAGWSDPAIAAHGGGIDSPEALVTAFLATLERQAIDRVSGQVPVGADGKPLPVYVTPSGLDLRELTHKFLTGAIAFHQAADDYLDDADAGKGLRSSNAAPTDGSAWTALEHAWDEGFGYFGAARDFALYTDEELSAKGGRAGWDKAYHDTDGDGAIDLGTEYNFGHSLNCAKRDLGARPGGETDLTRDAIEGFLEGRTIITGAAGRELDATETAALLAARDRAVGAWEEAIAASALHYVNDTLKEMAKAPADYSFATHAKVWSELKGFALSLQFNPRSPMSDEDFDRLHELLGDAPVLASAGEAAVEAYRVDLRAARALLAQVYDFAAANLGDDHGQGGW